MFFFERSNEDNKFVKSAKEAPAGLPYEQLVPGILVTISPCRCTGDRSYSYDIWEITSANEGHVVIVKHKRATGEFAFNGPYILSKHEHEFYGAHHLASGELGAEQPAA